MALDGKVARTKLRGWALLVAASLAWLAAWFFVRGAFGVWVVMFVVYTFAVGVAILFAPAPGRSPAFDAWRQRFFSTGGVMVVSGLLSLAYVALAGIVLLLISILRGAV
jgi:hypothetical protein